MDAIATYYSSEWGAHTKAWAKLATLMVTFAAAAIAVEMSFSAGAVFKTLIVSVLSALLTNLINPASLETALTSTGYSILIGICAALAVLKIPNPSLSNTYFRPAFSEINLLLAIATISLILGLPL